MKQQTKTALITFLELYLAELKSSDTPESTTIPVLDPSWLNHATFTNEPVVDLTIPLEYINPEDLNLGDPADFDAWQKELDLKRHFGDLKDSEP